MKVVFLSLLFLASAWMLGAQESKTEPSPKPYTTDEFPLWAQDLRRYEVVSIGSWPISYFWTNLVYDIARWAVYKIEGTSTADSYAPLFFAPANKPANTSDENTGIILASVGVALIVGLVDHLVEVDKRNAALEHQAYLQSELFKNSLEAPAENPPPADQAPADQAPAATGEAQAVP